MKHMFLPMPIETVSQVWDEWRVNSPEPVDGVRLLATRGGCILVTDSGRPPRVFVDLLKGFLAQSRPRVAPAA